MSDQQTENVSRVYSNVQDYYGRQLQQTSDLKTSACCTLTPPHPIIADVLRKVPSEIIAKYYGCGTPIPFGIDGLHVLDLGSGSGRDSYIVSALVGPTGSSTGIDMTAEQLTVARRHVDAFTETLEYEKPNLSFVEGYIECLDKAGIASDSKDLVISNCVINLSPDKHQVLKEVFRVLREGGEFYFSDVYATRRMPENVRKHKVLHGECIGGALYAEDFKALCHQVGFGEPRLLSITPIAIENEELAAMVGLTKFYSITFRCFKVPHMEPREREEDYGHVATYLGGVPGHPLVYELDAKHDFERRRPQRVGGNTAAILKYSWLHKYFKVDGDWSEHFGQFDEDVMSRHLAALSLRQENSVIPVGKCESKPTTNPENCC